jgi:Ca-activated chloride channel family protein
MRFMWPFALWLLFLVPILAALYVIAQRRRQRYALRYASLALLRDAVGPGPGVRRHVPPALFLAAVAAMLFGLARPVAVVTAPSQEGTVVLAIDVSGSMLAEDYPPNRLEAAKAAAKAFVDRQGEEIRIGVVSFGGDASIVQEPTKERERVYAAIDRLRPQRATAIGRGILVSLDAILEQSDDELPSSRYLGRNDGATPPPQATPDARPLVPSSSTIILLSDGQNNQYPAPLDIVHEASDRGIRVYTIGVGTPEGTVVRFAGRSIRVRLDEETLQRIAQVTEAEYFHASNESELRRVYENLTTQVVLRTERTELTAFFTAAAALLSLLAGALSLLWFNRLP